MESSFSVTYNMVGNLLNFIYVLISLTNKISYHQIRKY